MSKIEKVRILPYKGEVLVNEYDRVEHDTAVAQMLYIGERPFVVDVANKLKIEANEIENYLIKERGEYVESHECFAEKKTMLGYIRVKSPVEGMIEYVSPGTGHVLIRENVSEDEIGPVTVNCAEALDVEPENLKKYLRKKEKDRVAKGDSIASIIRFGNIKEKFCRAPIFGEIQSIDHENGEVTIKRPVEEKKLKAHIPGVVTEVYPERGVKIETEGELFNGIIGFGGEKNGILGEDIVIRREALSRDEFEDLRKDVRGIIAPSIFTSEFVDIFEEQIAKGITVENDTGVTIILLKGFGEYQLEDEMLEKLKDNEGKFTAIDGRTQMRAGARRPEIVIVK